MKGKNLKALFAAGMATACLLCMITACTPSNGSSGTNGGDTTGGDEEEFVLPEAVQNYSIVWRDEFDGNKLNEKNWDYQHGVNDVYHGVENRTKYWGNNELQYYTEDAVTVEDGNLVITAEKQQYEGMEYTSARILTRDLQSFTFGYFEAKMKLPAEQGMWPAFWLLPQPSSYSSDHNEYGGWAASGELDIMEAKGREKNITSGALHFGGGYPANVHKSQRTTLSSNIDEWHTYGVDWRTDGITWYVDGTAFMTLENGEWYSSAAPDSETAPFDKPFYILFNLAVGGNFDGGVKPKDDFTSASMYVDYVRVFQKK